jgi:hypothetical protein
MALGPNLLLNVFQVSQSIKKCVDEKHFQHPCKKFVKNHFLVCGQKFTPSAALIVKGDIANKVEFPWQVAIYRRRGKPETNQLICGGTLISESFILTGDFFTICRLSGQM